MENKLNDQRFFRAVALLCKLSFSNTIRELEKSRNGKNYMERIEIQLNRLFNTTIFSIKPQPDPQPDPKPDPKPTSSQSSIKPVTSNTRDYSKNTQMTKSMSTKSLNSLHSLKLIRQNSKTRELMLSTQSFQIIPDMRPSYCAGARSPLIAPMFPTINDKQTTLR